jgi:hypothetical protein
MYRELVQIILAIQLSTSNVLYIKAVSLAKVMQKDAVKEGIDPFILIAIAQHESKFHESIISQDGEDYGLLQIRARHYGSNPNYLLVGENNINVGSYIIRKDKEYCERELGRKPATQEWLSVYQGSQSAYKCKPTAMTNDVETYAMCLQNNIVYNIKDDCKAIYSN